MLQVLKKQQALMMLHAGFEPSGAAVEPRDVDRREIEAPVVEPVFDRGAHVAERDPAAEAAHDGMGCDVVPFACSQRLPQV